jgi:hypothetical protein
MKALVTINSVLTVIISGRGCQEIDDKTAKLVSAGNPDNKINSWYVEYEKKSNTAPVISIHKNASLDLYKQAYETIENFHKYRK